MGKRCRLTLNENIRAVAAACRLPRGGDTCFSLRRSHRGERLDVTRFVVVYATNY
jgi:hypothetical protein